MNENKLLNIVDQYGSPLYLFSIDRFQERIRAFKQVMGDQVDLCFAMKANPFLVAYADRLIERFEVCSPGEYAICKKEKIQSEKIVMSGVYKAPEDVAEAFADNFSGIYTIESFSQYRLIAQMARKNRQIVRILFRLTSGNQFGLDKDDIISLLQECRKEEYLTIEGIHYFSGTQKKSTNQFQRELQELDSFCALINDTYHIEINNIEYGPGLFYDYFGKETSNYQGLYLLRDTLQPYISRYHFTIELGRYLSAPCGQYLTTVVDVKRNKDINYCIVDGGIHHLNYFGQLLGAKVPSIQILRRTSEGKDIQKWVICGALCTIHDILLKNYESHNLSAGDLFVFNDAGAYSITETCGLFLSRNLPKVLVIDGDISVIRNSIPTYHLNSRFLEN